MKRFAELAPIIISLVALLFTGWSHLRHADSLRAFDARFQGKASHAALDELRRDIELQRQIFDAERCRCQPEGAEPVDGEKFGAGGRILPDTRETLARALEILEKVNSLIDDVDSGRAGAHIEGSLWSGKADITLKRQ